MRAAWASLQPGAVQVIQNVGQREREEAGITAEEEAHHFAGTDVADLTHEGRMAILDEGRRNAANADGNTLVYKTHDDDAGDDEIIRKSTHMSEPVESNRDPSYFPTDATRMWAEWVDERIASRAAQRDEVLGVARATREFADAVDRRLSEMETLINKLQASLELLRTHDAGRPSLTAEPLCDRHKTRVN
jgi:hypothetical protein